MNQTVCQFENTVKDLQQLLEILRSSTSLKELLEESSIQERSFMHHLPHVCKEILDYYEYSRMHQTYEYFRKQKESQQERMDN